jgi:hypothetical protein
MRVLHVVAKKELQHGTINNGFANSQLAEN